MDSKAENNTGGNEIIADMKTDEATEMLKQEVVKCKLGFTALRNKIGFELCSESSDVNNVLEAVEMMKEAQERTVSVMSELSKLCLEKKNLSLLKAVSDDMNRIYSESYEAQETACKT